MTATGPGPSVFWYPRDRSRNPEACSGSDKPPEVSTRHGYMGSAWIAEGAVCFEQIKFVTYQVPAIWWVRVPVIWVGLEDHRSRPDVVLPLEVRGI